MRNFNDMWFKKQETDKIEVFFVRGFQRSGTNWVSNLLNLHPDISSIGEFHFQKFNFAYTHALERPHGILKQHPEKITKNFQGFIKQTIIDYNKKPASFIADRTPMAINSLVIPNHKYVLIQRDGRDVLVSWIYHLFRIGHEFGEQMENKKNIFLSDNNYFEENKKELLNEFWVRKIAKAWNKRILSDHQSIQNATSFNIQVFPILYEDLLNSTEEIRKKMYSFIGADPSKAKQLTTLTKPGFEKHDPASHYRKGESGRWKDYFTDEQLEEFEKIAREALDLLSYKIYT